jgi:hypothetical protein
MTRHTLTKRLGKHFMPPDNGDKMWNVGSETFTREEAAYLLWTQIAAIGNDLKTHAGSEITDAMFEILDNPRIPVF